MDDGAELDALRRRVYGPDATPDDRRRYAALLAAEPAEPAEPLVRQERQDPALPAARWWRHRWPLAVAGVTLVVAIAVVVALLRPTGPALRAPEVLPTNAEQRDTIVNALVIGTDAGISAYLMTNREPREIQGASSVYTVEKHGTGPGSVRLLPGSPRTVVEDVFTGRPIGEHGRATVLLTVAEPGSASWRAETPDGTVAARGGWQSAGGITSATFDYADGHRPTRLAVQVPAGVPWGAAVVFTD